MPPSQNVPGLRTALVLSGGGARGAYEAGVVSFLRDELEPRLGRPLSLDILCGTSVGGVTACLLASTADNPARQGAVLRDLWSRLTLEEVLKVGVTDVPRVLLELGGGGLFNSSGLRQLLLKRIHWPAIGRNLRAGNFSALSVATTRVADGATCLWVQRAPGGPAWPEDPRLKVFDVRIGPRHAMASAAMPILFPAVELERHLHVDGGLRLNVPLSPALRMGARRVIVVTMQPRWSPTVGDGGHPEGVTGTFLAGKAINALMQDRSEHDVDHLRQLNGIIESGFEAFGPSFGARLNAVLVPRRHQPMRHVRNLVVRPSRDLGLVANRLVRDSDFCRRHHQLSGVLLSLLASRDPDVSADLASYLLFDAAFAEELISLGRADARASEEEWVRFFDDRPANEAEAAELAVGRPPPPKLGLVR